MSQQEPEQYLTPEERRALQRSLSFPEEFPQKFGSWIADHMAVNGTFSRSQIQGLSLFTARVDQVGTAQAPGSSSYGDLATAGPSLTGLGDGTYLILFGCQMSATANYAGGAMSVSINDAAATDGDGFAQAWSMPEGAEVESASLAGSRAVLKTLDGGGNNTITTKYRQVQGSAPSMSNRWLVALRVGN